MDIDILKLTERIQIALQIGESHFREFKSGYEGPPSNKRPRSVRDVCIDIIQALVAFANADGGELIIGVEDDGTVTGLDYTKAEIEEMKAAPKTHVHKDTPLPEPRIAHIKFDGKSLLYFSITKGVDFIHLTADGRCLQRRDRQSVPMATEIIRFTKQEVNSREYDRAFINNADMGDLDAVLLTKVADHVSKGMSIEKCLQHLELAEYDGTKLKLRRAALLLFSREPNKWHPRLQVRVLKIDGTEMLTGDRFNVSVDKEETGNLLTLIESSWDLLRPHLTETRFSKDAKFKSQIMYPELACREALVNAIAHRDYSNEGRGIEVRVYSNRLEITSPGGLLSSINIEDLRKLTGVHQSRNSLLSRVLREVGYMRELGEGMRRIYELMKSNDLTPPELYSDHGVFRVVLHHRFIYSREEKLWLDAFEGLELSREQKTIVLLGYNNHTISPKEIWDAVGIVDTDYYRKLLESLRYAGVLDRSVPKKDAFRIAKEDHIPVKNIPQFSVSLPDKNRIRTENVTMDDESEYVKLFIGNVPYHATQRDLEKVMSEFGVISDICMPIDRDTERLKGFAFVEYETVEAAQEALRNSGKIQLLGRTLYLQKAERKTA